MTTLVSLFLAILSHFIGGAAAFPNAQIHTVSPATAGSGPVGRHVAPQSGSGPVGKKASH